MLVKSPWTSAVVPFLCHQISQRTCRSCESSSSSTLSRLVSLALHVFLMSSVLSVVNASPSSAAEGCTVPPESIRTQYGGDGHGQQPHGASEGRTESTACPTPRCSITCTTSGTAYLTVKNQWTDTLPCLKYSMRPVVPNLIHHLKTCLSSKNTQFNIWVDRWGVYVSPGQFLLRPI